jgi:hypothetical protein
VTMGRRSTSTTKSGKYMNPTDQARKEARRRELKKVLLSRMLLALINLSTDLKFHCVYLFMYRNR